MKLLLIFLSVSVYAQQPSLEELSNKMNKDLPEIIDPVTKLQKTTVENNNLYFNFIVDAKEKEFSWALPKVKSQILSTICSKGKEKALLVNHRANLVYKYESVKGTSLGEFMVRPEHCSRY